MKYVRVPFTTDRSFIVPSGVYKLVIQAWGGGGAGGTTSRVRDNETLYGGGGGGGGYVIANYIVEPGITLSLTIGHGLRNKDGGTTVIRNDSSVYYPIIYAYGGIRGTNATIVPGIGGKGGSGSVSIPSISYLIMDGGNGDNGNIGGTGGAPGGLTINTGKQPGDGGNGIDFYSGYHGNAGQIIIEYITLNSI